ncbi:MAG: ABC-2 family transporter protein [Anaerolineae bacterium]
MLDIYRQMFKIEFAVRAQYRASLVLWLLGMVTEPVVYLTVWENITAAQGGSVGTYTAGGFAAYYIALMFVRQATAAPGPNGMESRIRGGELSGLLLRPLHPIHGDIADNLARKVWTTLLLIPISLTLIVLFSAEFQPIFWSLAAFVPVLLLSSFLRFFIHWAIGLSAFWTTRMSSLFSMYVVAQVFFAGRLAPLDLMPQPIQAIASVLPFRWVEPFAIDVVLGRLTPDQVLQGCVVQLLWIGAMLLLLQGLWVMGLKQFSAVGA